MSKNIENHYKTSRTTAAITQEQAAELLGVAPRTLSDYENGHAKVPDDIVTAMAKVYKCPLLVWWHLKNHSIFGEFLPDISVPQTNGDMAFQLILAQDDLMPTVTAIKQIVANRKICENTGDMCDNTRQEFTQAVNGIKGVKSKLFSAVVYAEKLIAEE